LLPEFTNFSTPDQAFVIHFSSFVFVYSHHHRHRVVGCWVCSAFKRNSFFFFLIRIVAGGVQLGPFGTTATSRLTVPASGDYDDGETGGVMIGKGNRSTQKKPAPMPICPPQTIHACLDANPGLRGLICGGQSGSGAGFLRVLRFLLPIFIPPISPQSPSPIIRGWYKRPVVAAVPKVAPV
jgi:hypothetical protein